MDNITHTLIGIAAAEGVATTRRKPRLPLWIASALANNLPDLDVLLTPPGSHERIDYLLQHRGYTHTLLLGPLQSLLLLAALAFFWRRRKDLPWPELLFLIFLGPLLHLFADSWNSYGVHPYWPFDNRWRYGDLIFIVEPWLWVALLPVVWSRAASRTGKTLALLLLGALLSLAWYHPFVLWPVAAGTTAAAVAWIGAQRLLRSDRLRIGLAVAFCVGAFAFFAAGQRAVARHFPGEERELALQPHPGNPFCWTALTAGFEGPDYVASAWAAAPWPALVPAADCPRFTEGETSANLQPMPAAPTEHSRVPLGEFRRPRAELEEIARGCYGRAFLRFARVPFWFTEGGRTFLGDLRFDRSRAVEFAEIPLLPDGPECARFELPWEGRFLPPAGG